MKMTTNSLLVLEAVERSGPAMNVFQAEVGDDRAHEGGSILGVRRLDTDERGGNDKGQCLEHASYLPERDSTPCARG